MGAQFGLIPRSIRTTEMVSGWGSCGPEGNILIDWHLIFAPSKVLEYVVIHEVSHLQHRSHGPEFWNLLRTMMPKFEEAKAWLDRHGSSLGSEFLSV